MTTIQFDCVGLRLRNDHAVTGEKFDTQFGEFAGEFDLDQFGDICAIRVEGFRRVGSKIETHTQALVEGSWLFAKLASALRAECGARILDAVEDMHSSRAADAADHRNRQLVGA